MNKLYLYGVIGEGDLTAKIIQQKISDMGNVKEIDVHINSGGGSVTDGTAIHTMLKNHKAKVNVHIDSLAASIASVIAMAGDTVNMAYNGLFMLHNAMVGPMSGNQQDLEKMADTLGKITSTVRQAYMSRSIKVDEKQLTEMMDNESWLNSSEALELGFVDNITKSEKVSASVTKEQLRAFNNVPDFLSGIKEGGKMEEEEKDTQDDEQEEEEQEETKTEKMLQEVLNKLDVIIDNTKKDAEEEQEEEEEDVQSQLPTTNNLSKLLLNIK